LFKKYVEKFGFGKATGIEIGPEVAGDIRPLSKPGEIFAATASFGQGIAVTPLQMVAAFAALGNGGTLYRPHLVQEVVHPDGSKSVTPREPVRDVISSRTSRLVSGMMVTVVEQGHGKRAAVPGYYVAGKTGTAQIPNPNGPGYLANATIGSFAGYAPASDPKFVMLVKIDRPRTVQYAEASAAPVFGSMAKFLLTYLQVEPERPIEEIPLEPLPLIEPIPDDASVEAPALDAEDALPVIEPAG
jgi:cell division protein FtsI/penicillin-binding protein 2